MSHTERPSECHSCGWETTDLVEVGHWPTPTTNAAKEWYWHCQVCYHTMAGTATLYPQQYPGQVAMLKTIAWGINYLANILRNEDP